MSGNRKITIDVVAELCGVSKTTISRFLNGKYENISAEKREQIAKVISELDYRPNRSAQRLKSSRSMLIGCVVGDVSSPFSSLLLRGMSAVCEAEGYQLLFADSREDPSRERSAIQGFVENRVDGLLVNTAGGNDDLLIEIHKHGIPVALADRSLAQPGILDTVVSTDVDSAYECVRFLLNAGYETVALFNEGENAVSPRRLRKLGYEKAMRELLPGVASEVYSFSSEEPEFCRGCIEAFIDKNAGKRVAILSVNGVTAHHILLTLNDMGITPGYEVGLLTFDDWSWLRLAPPGISTVALSSEEIGARAARLLIRRAKGEVPLDAPAELITVPTLLKIRGSTPSSK